MRKETFDLSIGLGRLRWSDDPATLRQQYDRARARRARFGRNPRTGESLVIPAGTSYDIAGFITLRSDIVINAAVTFGGMEAGRPDRIEEITLSPDPASLGASPEAASGAILELGERLGCGPIDPERMQQSLRCGPANLDMFRDSSLDFALTIHVPAPSL